MVEGGMSSFAPGMTVVRWIILTNPHQEQEALR
jgi:hypothetical protein